jgi:nicotinate-nucleotide adenylyltransferase
VRIGIYGGTFNPPHVGHLRAAQYAIEALGLEKLLLIPSCIAPHKKLPQDTPTPRQRAQMVQIAAGEKMEVSSIELDRGGTSFTYETVAKVAEQHPGAEIFLLMGSDMFLSFHSWKNPEKILEKVTVAVLYRGDRDERTNVEARKVEMDAAGYRVELVANPVTEISSTQIRRLLAFQAADEFLPSGVGDYIRRSDLYDGNADWKNLPMEQLEQVVISLVKPSRVAHILGCRDTAVALAKRWGVDETDAARAGLLHDITKALDGSLQLTLCRSYGRVLDDFSRRYPKTLHALTGSLVAQRIFGENEAVVSAIECHTTGKAAMNMLEKIIYVADYMEPNRDFPGVEELRRLAFSDMDAALRCGLHMTLEHLARQGAEVSPASHEALEYLKIKV